MTQQLFNKNDLAETVQIAVHKKMKKQKKYKQKQKIVNKNNCRRFVRIGFTFIENEKFIQKHILNGRIHKKEDKKKPTQCLAEYTEFQFHSNAQMNFR